MTPTTWEDARRRVVAEARKLVPAWPQADTEELALADALGRVLAVAARVDRDLPPFRRSTRDGFAVRAADVGGASPERPARLEVAGEVKAGGPVFPRTLAAGEAVEIFTGAPLPEGADCVVMVEDVLRDGGDVLISRPQDAGDHFVPTGAEARAGDLALPAGTRLGTPQLGLLAALGVARPRVARPPAVSIVSTGDEIVEVTATPGPTQIRNSNAVSLAAQVLAAGGRVAHVERAPDDAAGLDAAIARARAAARVVVFSGGVSMGKHDLVEAALAQRGAEVVWNGVAIRPGKPAVFGRLPAVDDGLFFGLPGNPLSTMVTFELFVRPALAVLAGAEPPAATPMQVVLAGPLAGAASPRPLPLTQFVPARLDEAAGGAVPIASQGSGDLVAMARADGWLVVPPHAQPIPGQPLAFLAR